MKKYNQRKGTLKTTHHLDEQWKLRTAINTYHRMDKGESMFDNHVRHGIFFLHIYIVFITNMCRER